MSVVSPSSSDAFPSPLQWNVRILVTAVESEPRLTPTPQSPGSSLPSPGRLSVHSSPGHSDESCRGFGRGPDYYQSLCNSSRPDVGHSSDCQRAATVIQAQWRGYRERREWRRELVRATLERGLCDRRHGVWQLCPVLLMKTLYL